MNRLTKTIPKKPFEEVYAENYRRIYNAVYMRLLNRDNTEDVVQETFIKALRAYDRYDPKIASIPTWLNRIAANAMTDRFRRDRSDKLISLDDYMEKGLETGKEDPELARITDNNSRELYAILTKLKDEERELLVMRFVLELSYKEMAERLSSTDRAVAKRVDRLLEKCRRIDGDVNGTTT
ncbi:MAG: sigma-70 family RNA polymerase sigma factor [Lachnospiraceae bacterium]|nr:sigma-70 family RNA polymerase sigma factor [Lachnospiraceae bacterium]